MNASEIKKLTGAKTKIAGENILYSALENRKWHLGDREYTVAGFDRQKDLVHFTAWWTEGGGAAHSRLALSLANAVSNETGDLSSAKILH